MTPLRLLAGCWIQSRCPGCRNFKFHPIWKLLTERRGWAEMPLRRAVAALVGVSDAGATAAG